MSVDGIVRHSEGAVLKRFNERAAHYEMLCLKSPKSYLDRVSTGSGSDLVKPFLSTNWPQIFAVTGLNRLAVDYEAGSQLMISMR